MYKNGEYLKQDNVLYMWTSRVPGNTEISPKEWIEAHQESGLWTPYPYDKLIAAEIALLNFALIGSAVFQDEYMISQQGVDASGNPTNDFRKFGTEEFTPNLLLNFATGLFEGNNVKVNGGIFKNIQSPNGSFEIDEEGNIQIIGELSTSMNGTRIEISPKTNSIKMFNQDNNEVGRISFMTEEWMGITNYYPRVFLRRYSGNNMVDEIQTTGSSINGYSVVGSNYLEYNLGPFGLIFSENGKETKRYSNK